MARLRTQNYATLPYPMTPRCACFAIRHGVGFGRTFWPARVNIRHVTRSACNMQSYDGVQKARIVQQILQTQYNGVLSQWRLEKFARDKPKLVNSTLRTYAIYIPNCLSKFISVAWYFLIFWFISVAWYFLIVIFERRMGNSWYSDRTLELLEFQEASILGIIGIESENCYNSLEQFICHNFDRDSIKGKNVLLCTSLCNGHVIFTSIIV